MSFAPVKPLVAVSLRVRVAAWIAGAVLITGTIVLAVVREGVRKALFHELDANLQAEADEILLERAQLKGQTDRLYQTMELQARGHRDRAWYSQLLGREGNLLYATTTTPKAPPEPPQFASGVPETVGRFRVVEKLSNDASQSQVIVRVGTSMPGLHADMRMIDQLVGMGGVTVLLAAPLAGFVLATIALRPIREMTERTDRMQPQRLDERLPLRGTKDELDRLAVVINNLLGKIAQYVGDHRGIMADAAHQLRTPLAAIRSSVEVVLTDEEHSPDNRELLEEVIEQIESLETLVNQLLLLAETEVESLRPGSEDVEFDAIVRRSLDMFDAVAESCGVSLHVGVLTPTCIRGNRHYLRQVINNLIDNAIKFTAIKPADPRRISIDLTHDVARGIAALRVADTGIGINPAHLAHVFDRFYREESLAGGEIRVLGHGLGLSIVKQVVESHGGTVSVDSSLGVGTTFTISLPLSTAVGIEAGR